MSSSSYASQRERRAGARGAFHIPATGYSWDSPTKESRWARVNWASP
jgi:hypothetical protein